MGGLELALLGLIVPIFCVVGVLFGIYLQFYRGWSAHNCIIFFLAILTAMVGWGVLGYIPGVSGRCSVERSHVLLSEMMLNSNTFRLEQNPYGLKSATEMYIFCVLFGFCLGPLGGISRLAFVDMIPPGHEAEFFALMEISDKGSSWLGPLITTVIWTNFPGKEHIRLAFIYLFGICTVALALTMSIDMKVALRDASSLKMAMRMRKLKKKREFGGDLLAEQLGL